MREETQRSKTLLLLVICRLFVARLKGKLKGRKDLEYSTNLSKSETPAD